MHRQGYSPRRTLPGKVVSDTHFEFRSMVRAVEFMFVFGDASSCRSCQTGRKHKFLECDKFLCQKSHKSHSLQYTSHIQSELGWTYLISRPSRNTESIETTTKSIHDHHTMVCGDSRVVFRALCLPFSDGSRRVCGRNTASGTYEPGTYGFVELAKPGGLHPRTQT